jgi:beta-barrel assembly-enhancing protease
VRLRLIFGCLVAFALAAQDKEALLGARLAQDALQNTTVIDSAAARDYVENIAGRLASQVSGQRFSYHFSIVAGDKGGPAHEPLVFPGGYIVIPASLILTARNEAEFAGMLAHAMAHIAAGHGFRPAVKIGEVPMWFVAGKDESVVPVAYRSVQRGQEIEADAVAVRITSEAGYDPQALVRYLATTPAVDSRESRIAVMESVIRQFPPNDYLGGSTDTFRRLQDEVRRAIE